MGNSQISCCLTHTAIPEGSPVGMMLVAQTPQPAKALASPRDINTYWTPLTPIIQGEAGGYNDVVADQTVIARDVREFVTTGKLSEAATFRGLSFASTVGDFGDPVLNEETSLSDILDMARSGRLTCTFNLYQRGPVQVALWVAHSWAIGALIDAHPTWAHQLDTDLIAFSRDLKDPTTDLAKYLSGEDMLLGHCPDYDLLIGFTGVLCNPTSYGRSGSHLGMYVKHLAAVMAEEDGPVWAWTLLQTGLLFENMQNCHKQLLPAASHSQDEDLTAQVALAHAILAHADV